MQVISLRKELAAGKAREEQVASQHKAALLEVEAAKAEANARSTELAAANGRFADLELQIASLTKVNAFTE